MPTASRRTFLGLTVAVGAGTLVSRALGAERAAEAIGNPDNATDGVAALIALSRDAKGKAHIDRAAFVTRDGVGGTLPLSADEVDELRGVVATGDTTWLQQRGLRVDGQKFFFIRSDEDGRVIHAVKRGGEFVTARAFGGGIVVALCADGMVHNRAVEAVYQYVRRASATA